jgi:O-antigen/teichoic acid export membrane protein
MPNVSFGSMIRKSATYAVAIFATRALSFVLLPLYTRYLTPADYGVLELLDLTLNLIIVFAGARIGQALFYFYFAEPDDVIRARHLSTNLLGSMLLGAVALVVCWFLASPLSSFVFGTAAYAPYLRMTAVAMGLIIPMETGLCCVRAFNEPAKYALVAVARILVAGVLNVILLSRYHLGVASMLWSSIASLTLANLYLVGYVYRRVPVRFDTRLFSLQARYTMPLTFASFGDFLLNYGDRYFLRQVVSLSDIGIYSLAYKIGMLIPTIQWPFALYWSSQQVKIVRGEGGWTIFVRVCTYLTVSLTAVLVLIVLFIDPLLRILVTPAFRAAGKYAPWIALAYLLRAVGSHFREMFVVEKRPDLEARVIWAGTILCLAGYALLIPRFGIWGAIAATGLSFGAMFFVGYFISQRLRRVDYEYARMATVAVCAIAVVGIYAILRPASFWMQVGVGCALSLLFLGLLHVARFWRENEKAFIRNKLSRLLATREQAA